VIFGAASGPADPISPNALMTGSLSLSGGDLRQFVRSREEMLRRATDTIEGIRHGWLKLSISRVLPLSQAAEAHRFLENRQTSGKIVLSTRD
jgi:NADPH2:quinone reductase